MECEKEITVACTAKIAGQTSVQIEVPIKVETIVHTCRAIPAGDPVVVDLLRRKDNSPKFVLINPDIPDPTKVSFKVGKYGLRYNTTDCEEGARKPIKQTHVFYDGMAEWMTDKPGDMSLQQLVFWSDYEPGDDLTLEQIKKGMTVLEAIRVQIIVGYCKPCPAKAAEGEDDAANSDDSGGGNRE